MGRKKKIIMTEPEKLSDTVTAQITAVNFIVDRNLKEVNKLKKTSKNLDDKDVHEDYITQWKVSFHDLTKDVDNANKILRDILGIRDVINKLVEDTVIKYNPIIRDYPDLKEKFQTQKEELLILRKVKMQFMAIKNRIEAGDYVKKKTNKQE